MDGTGIGFGRHIPPAIRTELESLMPRAPLNTTLMDFTSNAPSDSQTVMNPPSATDRHPVLGNKIRVPPPAGPNQYSDDLYPPSRAPPNATAIYVRGIRAPINSIYTITADIIYPMCHWPPQDVEDLHDLTKDVRAVEDAIDTKIEQILQNPTIDSSTQLQRVERFKLPGGPSCWDEFLWVLGCRVDMIITDSLILEKLRREAAEEML
ncbi:hypothetical protein FQN54_004610 [Arachnomyces sp. PD_36]|nr:hypothetical protein FQN54_004610 [Arachnomyces sp. PD_36]